MKPLVFSHPKIRLATPADAAVAAPLIIQAMEDLACFFVNSKKPSDALPLFETFFKQKRNQYSFEHTLVYEESDQVAGTLTAYDGGALKALRAPFLKHIEEEYSIENFHLEEETEVGELYIDTVSVNPHFQGLGIGTKLIKACFEKAEQLNYDRVGLIVDLENPQAQKLYERLDFKKIKTRQFMGGEYTHMQYFL